MPALMEFEKVSPATGTPSSVWLRDQIAKSRESTGEGLPARLIWLGSQVGLLSSAMDLSETTTDPRASDRSRELDGAEGVRNLSNLASAARLIIPGLRAMTPNEQSSLRRYYKGIYRKA
jgi:hypothetical protein